MPGYRTENNLPSNTKTTSINILNARLAEAIDLALLTKQAHWNIKGPQFIALHEMIDGFRTEIHQSKDHLAALIERYGKAANAVRTAIDESDEAGDADTADIFTAYSRALDKALWFLEAHIQEPA